MNSHVDLIFHGELQPAADPRAARSRLAELLKLQPAQADALFSGRRVVLRRGLPGQEAERYVSYLSQTVGIRVSIEPHAAKPKQIDSAPQTAAADPSVEHVVCPQCGEFQPPRTLCRKCAVDMRRFSEAQDAAAVEAREASSQAASVVAEKKLKSGGRLRYAVIGLAVVAAIALAGRGPKSRTIKTTAPAAAEIAVEAVEIYTTHSCTTCAAAKAYMRQNDIAFTEYDVEGDTARRNEFYERGGKGVPLIFVRGRPMHGFDPDQFERLRAESG